MDDKEEGSGNKENQGVSSLLDLFYDPCSELFDLSLTAFVCCRSIQGDVLLEKDQTSRSLAIISMI